MTVVLVTGCAGFIGSHVAEKLLKRGDTVIGIDEVNDYYKVKQKEKNLELLKKHKSFVFYKKDITEYEEMKKIIEKHKPECVAHLYARAGVRPSIDNPFVYKHSNIHGTLVLLDLAKDCKVKNFVLSSSSSVYGNRDKTPFSEEDTVDRPISPYAATKKACELLAHTYYHLHNLNVTIIRPFTIYGPRGRPDMAPYKFLKLIVEGKPIHRYGDGSSKRDYTFIEDFAEGFVSALDKPLGYEIINLGNSNPVSLNEFIATIENVTGKKARIEEHPMQPGDVSLTYADTSKAKKLLGYNPKIGIKEGMEKFAKWFDENKEWLLKGDET